MAVSPIPVHLITLGCARNEVDSEELAARLERDNFRLVDQPADAEIVMVNTCGFIEQAKKDSIDTILAASDLGKDGKRPKVVAVGCLAQRYGSQLADSLPEADAVLGFDDYSAIANRLTTIVSGGKVDPPTVGDRRKLLPITPIARPEAAREVYLPGHGTYGPRVLRKRLATQPYAPLKIASGCDRRCAFCAIPSFRGSYISRPIEHILAEANWLTTQNVTEAMLVSENSSSFGKDWGEPDALCTLLERLATETPLEWIRVSYLQPAEIRPKLIETMVQLEPVVNYFDLSFQHASPSVLRRMRRFGDPDSFLGLIEKIRNLAPDAGFRTNVIVGFPGETQKDVEILRDFLVAARFDVVGVFAYSDEEGTEGAKLDAHLDEEEIQYRCDQISSLVDELCDQRAEERVGQQTQVIVEQAGERVSGRTFFQGPEVDGSIQLDNAIATSVGAICQARITASNGVDLTGTLT